MITNSIVQNLNRYIIKNDIFCKKCIYAKQYRISSLKRQCKIQVICKIFTDLCGKMNLLDYIYWNYFLLLKDDYSIIL